MILAAMPGFTGNQTAINPVGPGAAHAQWEFSLIFWITTAVYCIVLLTLVIAVARKRHSLDIVPEPIPTTEASDRTARRSVGAAMVATIVLLFIMLVGSFETSRALGSMSQENALTIEVYGHQWWWEVNYANDEAYKTVVTANEIH